MAKTYRGGIVAARAVDLAFESGELGVIVGPSGSGKSTLLRLIAGLEAPDAGEIRLDGRRVDGLPPRDRELALVFQDAVAYPHLDVFENIAFGLRARRVARDELRGRVEETAGMLGLGDVLRRRPTTLSGGQRRRVTLARALAVRPRLLLLDEPFAGLDAPLRLAIRAEIAALHRRLGTTMVLVTHDQAEALALADRLAVVASGRVSQVGPPIAVYDAPADRDVARFLGQPPLALVPCTLRDAGPNALRVDLPGAVPDRSPWTIRRGECPAFEALEAHRGGPVLLGLRAERVAVNVTAPRGPDAGRVGLATATVDRLEPAGHEVGVALRLGPHELMARVAGRPGLSVGVAVPIALDLDAALWFDPATGRRIGPALGS